MANLLHICISKKRREPKVPCSSARLLIGGIEGDSHFNVTEREISLLRIEDVEEAQSKAGFTFPPGALAENLVVEGLDLHVGDILKIGSARLEVIEKGKRPGEVHSYDYRGWCLLPTVGFFLKVLTPGFIEKGDLIEIES